MEQAGKVASTGTHSKRLLGEPGAQGTSASRGNAAKESDQGALPGQKGAQILQGGLQTLELCSARQWRGLGLIN